MLRIIKDRFLSFAMVLGIGFLLFVSLVTSTAMTQAGNFLAGPLPSSKYLLQISNFILSFGVITVLIAMVYKILPETRIHWRDVWMGATVASFLFTIGKSLIGLYLARSGIASAYGAAGSLVVMGLLVGADPALWRGVRGGVLSKAWKASHEQLVSSFRFQVPSSGFRVDNSLLMTPSCLRCK